MVLYVILFFVATCIGMAISVYAFGTGAKRKKIFQDIYFSVEDTDGIGVLYTKTGEYSAIVETQISRMDSTAKDSVSTLYGEESSNTSYQEHDTKSSCMKENHQSSEETEE